MVEWKKGETNPTSWWDRWGLSVIMGTVLVVAVLAMWFGFVAPRTDWRARECVVGGTDVCTTRNTPESIKLICRPHKIPPEEITAEGLEGTVARCWWNPVLSDLAVDKKTVRDRNTNLHVGFAVFTFLSVNAVAGCIKYRSK